MPQTGRLLRRASNEQAQLDPENKLVVEYLCVLYSIWKDPVNEDNDRLDEAKRWLERLAEVDPTNYYPDFYCGIWLSTKARKLLPNYGQLTAVPDSNLPSLRTKAGPLLEEARRHLTRALGRLTSDQGQAGILHFVDEITSMQTYLSDPEQSAREMHDKAMELFRKHLQPGDAQAGEEPTSSAQSSGITFLLYSGGNC